MKILLSTTLLLLFSAVASGAEAPASSLQAEIDAIQAEIQQLTQEIQSLRAKLANPKSSAKGMSDPMRALLGLQFMMRIEAAQERLLALQGRLAELLLAEKMEEENRKIEESFASGKVAAVVPSATTAEPVAIKQTLPRSSVHAKR